MISKSISVRFWFLSFVVAFGLFHTPPIQASKGNCAEQLTVLTKPAQATRKLSEVKRLKVASLNALNLYMHVGSFKPTRKPGENRPETGPKPKSEHDIQNLVKAMDEIDADIWALQEVEGIETLQAFADGPLKGRYYPIITKTNDHRGIHVAYLVKKDLPFELEARSHRDMTWIDTTSRPPREEKVMSRDFLTLILKVNGRPVAVFGGIHSKSQRSGEEDPSSIVKRRAQAKAYASLLRDYQKEFPGVPMFILGDFNSDPNSAPEYLALRKAGLMDSLDAISPPVDETGRVTHAYFPWGDHYEYNQLDAILIPEIFKGLVSDAYVYRYKNPETGLPFKLPVKKKQRLRNPSDHYPVVMELDFEKLVEMLSKFAAFRAYQGTQQQQWFKPAGSF